MAPIGSGEGRGCPRALLLAAAAGLAILVLAVYWPVRGHDFLRIDDHLYVYENSYVTRGLTREGVRWAFTDLAWAGNWHPVTWLSHMVDARLFGLSAGGHHVTSVLLHLGNAVLLLLLLAAATGDCLPAVFVAALFAAHPLRVESVAWVAERKDVLSAFFWFSAMGAWLWWLRRRGTGRYLAALGLYALALMSKAMPVTLPFLLLLLDWWPLGRWSPGKGPRCWLPPGRLWLEKASFLGMAAAASVVAFVAQSRGGYVISPQVYPLGLRLANACLAYTAYLRKMLWPADLAVHYPHPGMHFPWGRAALAALLLAAVTVLVLRARRARPYLPVGWLWYLGTLVPVIGPVQIGDQGLADRYTYVPLVGVFVMIAWGLGRLPGGRRAALTALAAAAVVVLAWTARVQVGYWGDSVALMRRALAVTRDNWQAHHALGILLKERGQLREAMAEYREALRIRPRFAQGYNSLGAAMSESGDPQGAMTQYMKALRIWPEYAEAHFNLGVDLDALGNTPASLEALRRAAQLKPEMPEAHFMIGRVLARQGRYAEAIPSYREALRLRPDYPEARRHLGIALAVAGARR